MSLKQRGIDYLNAVIAQGVDPKTEEFRTKAMALITEGEKDLPAPRAKALYGLAYGIVTGGAKPAAVRAPREPKQNPAADSGSEKIAQGTVVHQGPASRKREDLNSNTVIEVLNPEYDADGKLIGGDVGRTYSYGDLSVAKLQLGSRIKRHGGLWKLIKGLGPNSGEAYRLQSGEQELA